METTAPTQWPGWESGVPKLNLAVGGVLLHCSACILVVLFSCCKRFLLEEVLQVFAFVWQNRSHCCIFL